MLHVLLGVDPGYLFTVLERSLKFQELGRTHVNQEFLRQDHLYVPVLDGSFSWKREQLPWMVAMSKAYRCQFRVVANWNQPGGTQPIVCDFSYYLS